MKISFVATTLSLLAAVTANAAEDVANTTSTFEYLGVPAVHDDSSVAICGQDLKGCFTFYPQFLSERVRFGDYGNVGSTAQTWRYDKGMIRNVQSQTCIGIVRRNWSLKDETSLLRTDLTHAVSMFACDPDNLGQRWIIGVNNKLHAFANDKLCLNIRSDDTDAPHAGKDIIDLTECLDPFDDLAYRQKIQLIGHDNALESFVHVSQTDYGFEDIVRMAFWLDEEDTNKEPTMKCRHSRCRHVLQVFLADGSNDRPIYTKGCKNRVTTVNAAHLLASVPDQYTSTQFVARFGAVESEPFTVHPQQMHFTCGTIGNEDYAQDTLDIGLIVGGTIGTMAFLFVGLPVLHKGCQGSKKKDSIVAHAAVKPGAINDDEDAMTQHSDEETP